MSPKQKRAYEQMRKEMIAELENGLLVATNPLVRMTRLLQLASAYAEMSPEGKPVLADPSCKIDALAEIIDELGDQRAVVFAESRQLIELAYKRLVRAKPHGPGLSVGMITGEIEVYARKEAERMFNAGQHKVMLMTLGAGAEGLSFPGCSTEIFLQRSYSAVKNQQAEDRCHGIGRGIEGVATNIIDIITEDTLEPHVHEVLLDKAERLEEIARDQETLALWLGKTK
jgi:SNF2 family DNA or RNA helicase